MANKNRRIVHKENESGNTNGWDVLKTIINGLFNLLKIEKIICIGVLYLLIRDIVFSANVVDKQTYQEHLIDAKILETLLNNDNSLIFIMACIIAVLVVIILALIIIIKVVYKKEIDRLAAERSRLLHSIENGNFDKIQKHNSSDKI